jgi:branched-chain amino acid transport system permease protein
MDIFLQQIINGLVQGSIYALVALGYTMVYGIMGLINFAHGEVVMIGTLVTITVASTLIKAGMPVALAAMAGPQRFGAGLHGARLGAGADRLPPATQRAAPDAADYGDRHVDRPAKCGDDRLGAQLPDLSALLPKVNFELAGAHFHRRAGDDRAVSALTMGGLILLVYRTKLGMAMRATAQNPAVASLMGVNINRVIAAAFVIGSALGALAGIMVGTITKSPITRWASCSASRPLPRRCWAASATWPGR